MNTNILQENNINIFQKKNTGVLQKENDMILEKENANILVCCKILQQDNMSVFCKILQTGHFDHFGRNLQDAVYAAFFHASINQRLDAELLQWLGCPENYDGINRSVARLKKPEWIRVPTSGPGVQMRSEDHSMKLFKENYENFSPEWIQFFYRPNVCFACALILIKHIESCWPILEPLTNKCIYEPEKIPEQDDDSSVLASKKSFPYPCSGMDDDDTTPEQEDDSSVLASKKSFPHPCSGMDDDDDDTTSESVPDDTSIEKLIVRKRKKTQRKSKNSKMIKRQTSDSIPSKRPSVSSSRISFLQKNQASCSNSYIKETSKRLAHSEAERKRRMNLNCLAENLRLLIPNIVDKPKTSMRDILNYAYIDIQDLEQEEERLKAEIAAEEEKKRDLLNQLELLKS